MRVKDLIDYTLDFLNERRKAYRLMFRSDAIEANIVMKDFLEFSHWVQGPASETNEETWRLIGRQDMIRRIMQHSALSAEQLMALYNGGLVPTIIEQGDSNA